MKKLLLIIFTSILLIGLFVTSKYTLKYVHWLAKSGGYTELYVQTDKHEFNSAESSLIDAQWASIGVDSSEDGDIPNWPDAKELLVYHAKDTVWLALSLHNNLDINEPMISLAVQNDEGRDWYGSVDNFKYKEMISAGYFRKGNSYYGYNRIDNQKGVCTLKYDLASNTLFLGLPVNLIEKFKDKTFVASVGQKALWNDDFEDPFKFSLIIPE